MTVRADRGQASVEFALSLVLLLISLLAVIDFGIAYSRYVEVTNAARAGARYGSIVPLQVDAAASPDPENVKYVVKRYSSSLAVTDADIGVFYETTTSSPPARYDATVANAQYATSGNAIRVSLAQSYVPFTPFLRIIFPAGSLRIEASSAAMIE